MNQHTIVLGNQTLGSPTLMSALLERGDATTFHVVVPATPLRSVDSALAHSERLGQTNEPVHVAVARWRLQRALSRFEDAGLAAAGEVGPSDEFQAVTRAIDRLEPTEVIISVFKRQRSRWLSRDLPKRIRDYADVAVAVVEAPDTSERATRR